MKIMKLTKSKLIRIIREEVENTVKESGYKQYSDKDRWQDNADLPHTADDQNFGISSEESTKEYAQEIIASQWFDEQQTTDKRALRQLFLLSGPLKNLPRQSREQIIDLVLTLI
jgi:hypothetical protein